MDNQLSIFDIMYPKYKITKPIRLIEMFSGYGSQALALKYLGVPFEHWKTCEWAIKSIQAYKDIHFTDDNTDYSQPFNVDTLKRYLYNKGISSKNKEDKDNFEHPTIKPLNIIKMLINNSSNKNDIILDTFAGSGTTCLAAKETGRRYIGMEIDPEYHKIAVNRLKGITASGQTSMMFDDNGNILN